MIETAITLVDSDALSANPELFDRPQNLLFQQDIPARQFAYGNVVVKCSRYYHRVKSPNFFSGLLISDGVIESIDSIFIGEKEYVLPSVRGGLLENGVYNSGLFEVDPQLGGGTQTLLTSEFSDIDSTFSLDEIAHIVVRCHFGNNSEEHSKLWGSSIPDTVRVKGVRLLDVRDNTIKFSNNAALVIYHFLTNCWSKKLDPNVLDIASFKEAADVCGQIVGTEPRYKIDGIVKADSDVITTLTALLSSCGGAITYNNGKYYLHVDRPKTSSLTLGDDDIFGSLSVQRGSPVDERINTINARYLNSEIRGTRDSSEVYVDQTFLQNEGYQVFETIDLPFTSSALAAKRLAFMKLHKLRSARRMVINVNDLAAMIEPRSVITLNLEFAPELNGLYRVLSKEPIEDGYSLGLREYSPSAYDGIGGF